uniref:TLR4 interactor with leucine rich repeats n=1 Tax=Callorhinchus milii TaxID=7868 RepID=A0A4W3HDX4_CALMI
MDTVAEAAPPPTAALPSHKHIRVVLWLESPKRGGVRGEVRGSTNFRLFSCPWCPERCDCQPQHLVCTNRGLRRVPHPLRDAQHVLTYSLGGNFISNISAPRFTRFPGLLRLDLQYNKIELIHPKAFDRLSRLEELYLGNNALSSLPSGAFSSLGKLRLLNINDNRLKKLSHQLFAHLDNLIKLRLDGNALEMLQDALFKRLGKLLSLQLESNRIQALGADTFTNLGQLTYLNLARNNQTSLRNAAVFAHLRSLATLILAQNHIKYIGHRVFQSLQKLSKLSLSHNKISHIAIQAFEGLSGLKELLVNGNLLREVPGSLLDPLARLEQLDLSSNRIANVHPLAFKRLANLKVLKLKNNQLSHLSGQTFTFSGFLYSLDLSGNSWACDCRLGELRKWMAWAHAQGRLLTVFVRCHHPTLLSGKYLDYLTDSELQGAGRADLCSLHKIQPSSNVSEGARGDELDVQADQERTLDPEKTKTEEDTLHKPSPFPTAASNLLPKNKRLILQPSPTWTVTISPDLGLNTGEDLESETTAGETTSLVFTVDTSSPLSSRSEQYHYLVDSVDEAAPKPLITDPCEFNKLYITNLTVQGVTASTATIRWKVAHPGFRNAVYFRVLFDRFGQLVAFHRFIYVKDRSDWVTLRELREETPYIVCLESVISERVCQVASRDHCLGILTLPLTRAPLGVQHYILILSAANAFLVILGFSIWISKMLRRKLRRRRAPVNVRRMYSTRRPLRTMGSGVSAGDCGAFPSNRARSVMYQINEADLMDFQADRLMDINLRREDIGQRYAD